MALFPVLDSSNLLLLLTVLVGTDSFGFTTIVFTVGELALEIKFEASGFVLFGTDVPEGKFFAIVGFDLGMGFDFEVKLEPAAVEVLIVGDLRLKFEGFCAMDI